MSIQMSEKRAFMAMVFYLEAYYARTNYDIIGGILSDLMLVDDDSHTADPAAWEDWMDAVDKAMKQTTFK